MAKKSVRHIKIREIISSEQIETQDELVKRLNEYDLNVTQATVSRDIKITINQSSCTIRSVCI